MAETTNLIMGVNLRTQAGTSHPQNIRAGPPSISSDVKRKVLNSKLDHATFDASNINCDGSDFDLLEDIIALTQCNILG